MKPEFHYKIGDRVKIVDKRPKEARCGWVPGEMDVYLGRYGNVTKLYPLGSVCYKLDCDGEMFWWSEDCFDEVSKTLNSVEDLDFNITEVEFSLLLGG